MKVEGSFLVEDFINAITSQLDRVQDALRLKAVNRPLTYALKDLALELQVFVELDSEGRVRFRTSGPNETGASTVRIGFTTITKPMIEENTISLAVTRSPQLSELGLDPEEQKRLEQLGVRNAAQLQRLGNSTGTKTVARLAGISVERVQQALELGRPQVTKVGPERPQGPPPPKTAPPPKVKTAEPTRPPAAPPPVKGSAPVKGPPPVAPPVKPVRPPRAGVFEPPREFRPPAFDAPPQAAPPAVTQPPKFGPSAGGAVRAPDIKVAPGTRRLSVFGQNLIGEGGAPEVRLGGRALDIAEADDERLVVEMPDGAEGGALEVLLPDGQQLTYNLSFEGDAPGGAPGYAADRDAGYDPGHGGGDGSRHDGRDYWEPERY